MPKDSGGFGVEARYEVVDTIRAEAARAAPEECCGLLLGQGGRIERAVPTANVAEAPRRFFEIDPQALIDAHRDARAGGPEVLGHYHSHPSGKAEPSKIDQAAAAEGQIWAIASADEVTFWRAEKHGLRRISCFIIDNRVA